MMGVPRHMGEHRLNVREGCPPVKQMKRGQAPERNKAIQEEVEKLVDAGIMKEVHYHSWLSNPVMVKKHDGNKTDAVLSLPSPGCLKDVQKLNGKLASLNRFLSKSAKKSLPFFKTLKKCTKKSDFQWTQEAEVAFKHMKKLIVELPMLTAPKEKEELIIYLASAKEAISVVLMTERGGGQTIASVLCKPCPTRAGGQLHPHGKIGISLAQRKQMAEKALPGTYNYYFIVERPNEEFLDELMAKPEELPEPWTLFTDRSSCIDGSGAGMILTNPEGVEFTYAMRTNGRNLQANVDSRLVANQVNGSYVAKESGMVQYLEKVKTLASNFKEFSIKQVPRSENKKADALSKIASTSFAHLSKQVLVEELKEKSIHEKEVLAIVEEEEQTWMTPICEYLTKEILPEDKKKARVVRRKASRYTIINGTLYKKSFLGPWLRIGLPGKIVSDNGKQFRDNPFKDWSLGEGIKARLDKRSKDWIREL
ncbi:reverse transcriptase domain-containing protein [Tanacetum coccineum]